MDRDKARRRRLAMRTAAELERLIQPGIRATSRIWRSMRSELIRAPVEHTDIGEVIHRGMMEAAPILGNAMAVSWLLGLEHIIHVVRPLAPVQLAYERELAQLFGKLTLSESERAIIIQQFGKNAASTLTMTGNALEQRLKPVVNDLISRGVHAREAVREMGSKVAAAGLGPAKTYQLEAIYRTQTQIAHMNARVQGLRETPMIDEMLWGYTYATVGDDRVRPEHAAQDGVTKPKDDPYWSVWLPPSGWNCRCTIVEVFQEEPVREPAQNVMPDEGFEFNPGGLDLAGLAAGAILGKIFSQIFS